MRRLILMRHAIADEEHQGADTLKPLTEEGREVQSNMGHYLKNQKIEIDGILYSPFTRAKQSAEILSQSYPQAAFNEEPALGEVFDSYTILRHVIKNNYKTALLVGHEPTLALLAAHLMKDYTSFKFEKSSLMMLDFEEDVNFGQGNFKFYLSPHDLEK